MTIPFVLIGVATDAYVELNSTLALPSPQTVVIKPGEPFRAVVAGLRERGVFTDANQARFLWIWARVSGKAQHIRAAEYAIKPDMTPLQLLDRLGSNDVVEHKITLVEGWRLSQFLAALSANLQLRHTLPADATPEQVMAAIGHADEPAEGRFFPDTYKFVLGQTDVSVLRRAYDAMTEHLAAAWAARDPGLPLDKPYDALIIASIIEKETGQVNEQAEIAGVFYRRLALGMKLQTDPTVIYGLGAAYDGDIHTRDLTTDTPYNTYTRNGLPPTPICSPGQTALEAAVHPAAGKALYFVAKGDGSHVFSDTLAEHNAAVRRYQLHEP
ncbi:MAG: endolytic transglycosylase MltG [Nevskiaceae bacterium]|nr:MAG: endolytic transglycosylase MltG [Nevskiaceae bacterium]TBR74773.1 MAG: endolytic transglycosylase MltG [Nevskiaceae bacterium]